MAKNRGRWRLQIRSGTVRQQICLSEPEGLENDAKDHDGIADDDRGAATKEIGRLGDDGESGKGADGHYAV